MPPVHSAMAAVSCSEYRPQDDQPCQREGPEAEVPSKLLESAFRTVGQIKNEIATDSQRCRRNQRYEVNHFRPPLSSGLDAAPRNCGWQRSGFYAARGRIAGSQIVFAKRILRIRSRGPEGLITD
jgi:hypothetical protein